MKKLPYENNAAETEIAPQEWDELLDHYRADREGLIRTAARMRDEAISYRGFKCGAALMYIKPGLKEGNYEVSSGHNFKPVQREERGRQKRCAERNAVDEAIKEGASRIVAIVSVSKETSSGDKTDKSNGALHLCKECRNMLRELLGKGILRDDSIICSVNDAERAEKDTPYILEERTVAELLAMYKDEDSE